jgi:phospholipase/carboxylesterase
VALLLPLAACGGGGGREPSTTTAPAFAERVAAPRRPIPGTPPPLLVLLHGIGADEDDLFPLAGKVDPRFRVVSLRAPHPYGGGFAWFHVGFGFAGRLRADVAQAAAALADLVRWLGAAPGRLGTDPRRTFLLGFSQGAMMSLAALGAAPERLAGVVALSARDPGEVVAPNASEAAVARVPVLLCHGTGDDVIPVALGRAARETLATRVRDLTYREFPIGHAISGEEMQVVAAWLAERL